MRTGVDESEGVEVYLTHEHRDYLRLNAKRMGRASISAFLRCVIEGGGPVVTWKEFIHMTPREIGEEIAEWSGKRRRTG